MDSSPCSPEVHNIVLSQVLVPKVPDRFHLENDLIGEASINVNVLNKVKVLAL